jgi:hypothetical protein
MLFASIRFALFRHQRASKARIPHSSKRLDEVILFVWAIWLIHVPLLVEAPPHNILFIVFNIHRKFASHYRDYEACRIR